MSFSAESRERTRPALPLSAMVDIMFLLLIFFMTASVFREQELQVPVDLAPSATAQAGTTSATQITINIDADDRIFLGPREHSLESLRRTLGELSRMYPHETVIIRGDRDSSYGLAVRVMDAATQAGLTDVRLAASGRSVEEIQ